MTHAKLHSLGSSRPQPLFIEAVGDSTLSPSAHLFWQPAPTPTEGGAAPAATDGGAPPPSSCAMQGGLIALMVLTFYFLIIRPQQRQQKAQEKLLRSLRPGLAVRTRGGLAGEIVEDLGDELVIRIADKVKVNVLRTHVTSLRSNKDEAADKKGAASSKGESAQPKVAS